MADTIRDYLVSLGFDIDGAGQAKFEATLKGVAANVVKLGAIVESTGLAIVGFTASIASGLDKLYWAAERTGASVNGIKALGYAASQTGSSAEAAQNSLESLARFMRSNPGAEGFLNRLGCRPGTLPDRCATCRLSSPASASASAACPIIEPISSRRCWALTKTR